MYTVERILTELKKANYKITNTRKKFVDVFVANQHRFITAKTLYIKIQQSLPTISYDTIYRTLDLFIEEKIIEKKEFGERGSKYRLICYQNHHHHVVCIACGKTKIVDKCPMKLINANTFDDFEVIEHRFEIYGYCNSCM
jgi:Fur family zinc uptake transcriptional regulator